ncbi:pimeloyl-ACP methyl ester carboxylesterase [Lacinutrix venerupis]|uniref:alpha/beta hydrolase n=1 Tax=Lacinutrix venerupis TaxID=1486034 RepID=UPI000EB50D7E|nr:alpha/beta hydrolase [Lacinutrix venerupis]RLJ63171.1 pimeloyl-ACP methyl ester carboxylesterase [Lacinutrix venerupis]
MILDYKGIPVFYSDTGKGQVVVLLHGFLEDSSMWDTLTPVLAQKNRVITIDLLGHGKTACLGYIHTMEDMANAVYFVLKTLKLRKYIFIGHSMGGYVALAFAKKHLESVKGLCLLNSTYQEDSIERKQLRARANKMAQNNYENMVRMSFANLFSAESKLKYNEVYNEALKTALKTPIQGYMSANEGMRLREDSSTFFTEASFKKIVLLGKKDTILDVENILKFTKKHNIESYIFSEGHMSHIENKIDFIKQIMLFVEKI